jgi:hypothetical protein
MFNNVKTLDISEIPTRGKLTEFGIRLGQLQQDKVSPLVQHDEEIFKGSLEEFAKHAEGKDNIADLFEPAKPKA